MNVKGAIDRAKVHIEGLFGSEGVHNVGLEEVEFDDSTKTWSVTIGFSRPWDEPANVLTIPNRRPCAPCSSCHRGVVPQHPKTMEEP